MDNSDLFNILEGSSTKNHIMRKCDDRCRKAKSSICTCECCGKNHGIDKQVGSENILDYFGGKNG